MSRRRSIKLALQRNEHCRCCRPSSENSSAKRKPPSTKGRRPCSMCCLNPVFRRLIGGVEASGCLACRASQAASRRCSVGPSSRIGTPPNPIDGFSVHQPMGSRHRSNGALPLKPKSPRVEMACAMAVARSDLRLRDLIPGWIHMAPAPSR